MTRSTDQHQFIALVEQHKGILYKAANAFCRDPEDRDDLVQEIIAQLWQSYGRYDPRQRFSTWMYRVAMNVAITHSRSESRRIRDAASIEAGDLDIRIEDNPNRDDVRLLHQLIGTLDHINRMLIILHLDGFSNDEIAEIAGLSATNVSTRLTRVRQHLQRAFDALQTDPGLKHP